MSTERLSGMLRNTIDLYELNRRVLDEVVALDWSDVQVADNDALDALLAGVDPARDVAALGLRTVPDDLMPRPAPFITAPASDGG